MNAHRTLFAALTAGLLLAASASYAADNSNGSSGTTTGTDASGSNQSQDTNANAGVPKCPQDQPNCPTQPQGAGGAAADATGNAAAQGK